MKATVLAAARRRMRSAEVPWLTHFSVREWRRRPRAVLRRIAAGVSGQVAVRSSACDEDGVGGSRAGHYRSVLGVANEPAAIAAAIERVAEQLDGNLDNRVLVQAMVRDIVASGVITTRDAATGGPYYVVEYDESGRSDTVTGGLIQPSSAVVFRQAVGAVGPTPVRQLLGVAREVERWWRHTPLEIEFALARDGRVSLLQVRSLALPPGVRETSPCAVAARLARLARELEAVHETNGVAGARTILSQMSDWNPAELIGAHPSPLASSLFSTLITDDVWRRARGGMGYRRMTGIRLVRLLGGRPYVDVRASFTSFLPAQLPERIATVLVEAWLQRLHDHPQLHDKVELEIAQTAVDLAFASRHRARCGDILSRSDFAVWRESLRRLTMRAIATASGGSLADAVAITRRLRANQVPDASMPPLTRAGRLLERCRRFGTLAFAVVARHAFIAEDLLRSGVERGAWAPERLLAFRQSLETVASELARDLRGVASGRVRCPDFLRRYGHVRPSSFDVTSPRYDRRPELFRDLENDVAVAEKAAPFALAARERRAFDALGHESGLGVDGDTLLRYAAAAIVARERTKLEWTRLLSEALECIAEWGVARDLSRPEVACLTLTDLGLVGALSDVALAPAVPASGTCASRYWRALVERRHAERRRERVLRLSPLLRGRDDLYVPPVIPALPTFVTARTVIAPPVLLDGAAPACGVTRRIVCIESADPGFDWIFAHRIAGLVTCFGGGNSHMAIRCIEANVPAAIGVGTERFARVGRARLVELRCGERLVNAS